MLLGLSLGSIGMPFPSMLEILVVLSEFGEYRYNRASATFLRYAVPVHSLGYVGASTLSSFPL